MTNLVIGNTSQLSHYFPEDYEKISSRDIKINDFAGKQYDRIYLCFAEQRTFMADTTELYYEVNINYTIYLIRGLIDKCNKIIVYGTSELWNQYNGPINIKTPFNFKSTNYIDSKHILTVSINQLRRDDEKYKKVIILHPYNFNSVYRSSGFLFGKIFDSIINKKQIIIGNTYFYRELLHPKFVVEQSIKAKQDQIIGSGRIVFVNDFIRDLYTNWGLSYHEYVNEVYEFVPVQRGINYLESNERLYSYQTLLNDTLNEIRSQNKTG
jgi:nucleoside-diphosphate-sugar epimerase